MFLTNTISKTKKFFHKTLQSFKSLLSGGYQRLPKSPHFNPFSCGGGDASINQSFRELDNFYTEFTNRWEFDECKSNKRSNTKKTVSTKDLKKEEEDVNNGSFMKFARRSLEKSRQEVRRKNEKKMRNAHEGERNRESCSNNVREKEGQLIAQKLQELEMMDVSNVDHVLDIEEVLHYYSRLTCPFYQDIVNKFFMEMCAEFFVSQTSAGARDTDSRSYNRPL